METSAMMLAATLWSQVGNLWLAWVWPILEFVLGLGLVVFVHELGHFLMAKAVGIKVERFALGFGPRLLGVQWGGTDYCIRALPLGGYIKMLGQDDFRPRQEIAEEDDRSYNAKPVWARLAVVSAGVVMNALLALVLFVIIALVGRNVPTPVLGSVRKHFPASEVKLTWHRGPTTQPTTQPTTRPTTQPLVTEGLRVGDRITRIDGEGAILALLGKEVSSFSQLAMLSALADRDEVFAITVEREVNGETWVGTGEMGVRMGPGEMQGGQRLSFGISPAADLLVKRHPKYAATQPTDPFREDDRVLAIAGRKVRHEWDVEPAVRQATGPTVAVTISRGGKDVTFPVPRGLQFHPRIIYLADGTKLNGEDYSASRIREEGADRIVFTSLVDGKKTSYKAENVFLAEHDFVLDLLGMVPRLRVTAIVPGSPADRAGLKAGDIIVEYGDTSRPTLSQLRKISQKVHENGTHIAVERGGKRIESIKVTPRKEKKSWLLGIWQHVDLAGTTVAGIRPGSPAEKAGIESGSVIDKVNDTPVKSWLEVHAALKAARGKDVTLTVRASGRSGAKVSTAAIGRLDESAFDPRDYEFTIFPGPQLGFLATKEVLVRKEGLDEAVGWSVRQTGMFIVSTYASLRSLIRGTVSTKDVMGPVGIGGHAIRAARMDIRHLVFFMGYLSAILAVINFLPLPVVDGGHAVFLIFEKIRGKPVPLKVMNAIQMAGLALIVLLFLAVTYQDIMRYFD